MTTSPATLDGRVALVTGASAGIGLAVCRELVAAGARVAMVARTQAKLETAAASLGGGERAVAFPLDVGDLPALGQLPEQVAARFGRLDVVVNNAGLHHRGPVAQRSTGDLATMVKVNLAAPIVLSRAALPLLPRGSAIVNVASLAGFVPLRDAATYSATKAGLRAFGRALGDELRPRGIAVCTVSPGPVDTDFFLDELDSVTPITFSQPMSTPERVAAAVVECLRGGRREIAIPWFSGKLATLGYLSPAVMRVLRPWMERVGAKKKAIYAARRRASAVPTSSA
ncbi:MAG TPA: SDR family NAD(P)-dependent oxidoreductase [Thermoanaerobaculia bacterium]|nr:SDR family NAD(P)-dependent oxidoreductase [Thermoanaerobaculia bacterium]